MANELENIYKEYREKSAQEISGLIEISVSLAIKVERRRIMSAFDKYFTEGGSITPAELVRVLEGRNNDDNNSDDKETR